MRGQAELVGRTLVLFLAILVASGVVFHGSILALTSDGALSRIEQADTAVQQAFAVVLEAEKAGANVSGLLVNLTQAGDLLANSWMAYRNGNLTDADSKAGQATLVAGNVTAEATSLKASAAAQAQTNLQMTLLLSVVGATVFLAVVILTWRFFKRAYLRKLGQMRPEAANSADA